MDFDKELQRTLKENGHLSVKQKSLIIFGFTACRVYVERFDLTETEKEADYQARTQCRGVDSEAAGECQC